MNGYGYDANVKKQKHKQQAHNANVERRKDGDTIFAFRVRKVNKNLGKANFSVTGKPTEPVQAGTPGPRGGIMIVVLPSRWKLLQMLSTLGKSLCPCI